MFELLVSGDGPEARILLHTGLRLDLDRFLRLYITERPHQGWHTKGRISIETIGKAKMWER
jgi:hypothetical protein